MNEEDFKQAIIEIDTHVHSYGREINISRTQVFLAILAGWIALNAQNILPKPGMAIAAVSLLGIIVNQIYVEMEHYSLGSALKRYRDSGVAAFIVDPRMADFLEALDRFVMALVISSVVFVAIYISTIK